jgi:hypothetical protein
MTLKVMTWNVENLFRPGSVFGPKTKAIHTEKLDALAATINEQAPHTRLRASREEGRRQLRRLGGC